MFPFDYVDPATSVTAGKLNFDNGTISGINSLQMTA